MKKVLFSIAFSFLLNSIALSQNHEIDDLIMPYVKTNNFSGSILVSKNGEVIFSKAYGPMNRSYNVHNITQTKFFVASVSMIFTSAAIMKLVEDNKMALDDPLSKYLPEYRDGNIITIHHLMSQRSGIPPIGYDGKVNYDSIIKFSHNLEKLIAYFKEDSLLFQPNSDYNHGRSDYIILAYIIEKVTGKPYGDYLEDALFNPLYMNDTGHSTGEQEIVFNLAAGYSPKEHYDVENAPQIDWTSKTGHGSIYSTVEDLNKFADAILNNRVLAEESWQKIFTDYGKNVGYGWFIRNHLDKKRFQMNGRSPGFSSYFAIYPDDNLVVAVLSNNYISLSTHIGLQIAALIFNKSYTKTNLLTKKLNNEQVTGLTGKFKFDEKFYVPNFELEVTFNNGYVSTSWGALIPVDEGGKHFDKFILRTYWSDIEFIKDTKGQVEAILFDGFRGDKIK